MAAAHELARELDRAGARGPLHGLPLGVKDIIDTFDLPTEYGSPIYAGHRPAADAACVALARGAGALVFGKTVSTEFATHPPGPTTNPHNAAHPPGGPSSGSGAAVAGRMLEELGEGGESQGVAFLRGWFAARQDILVGQLEERWREGKKQAGKV